ncbi:MAG: hypothetical protein CM1200mP30_26880 [Pseudomonadota bacterium]|nr:MAG: hypothetical protein CM1200mP30_26880 [Pseudomonadota bacterium]
MHGSCIVKIAKLHMNYAELTFLAEEFQVETSVLFIIKVIISIITIFVNV